MVEVLVILLMVLGLTFGYFMFKYQNTIKELQIEVEIDRVIIDALNDKLRNLNNINEELEENYIDLKLEFDKLQRNVREPMPTRSGEPRMVLLGTFEATAYTDDVESQGKWVGQTATGIKPQVGVVAVDPKVIPLGTKLYVEGYGNAIAGDTGGAIKGNRLDLFMETRENCMEFGRQNVKVWIVK